MVPASDAVSHVTTAALPCTFASNDDSNTSVGNVWTATSWQIGPRVYSARVCVVLPVSSTKVARVPLPEATVPVTGTRCPDDAVTMTSYARIVVTPAATVPGFQVMLPVPPTAGCETIVPCP